MQRLTKLVILTFTLWIALTPTAGWGRDFTLVIDAGHGGKDPGAIGSFSKEKNINLNVALKLGELIKQNCPNVKVVFTRKTDVFIPLDDRAEIANKAKADLFISIHTNALPKGRLISGSETYSLGMARADENLEVAKRENAVILYESDYKERYAGFNPNSSESYIIFDFMQDQYMAQSAELAKAIQKNYVKAGRPNKGVHQAGFLVLRKTSMPSVLTELGFITTPSEERYMNTAKGIDQLARSIYNGFIEYRNNYERNKTPLLPTQKETPKAKAAENDTQADETAAPESETITPTNEQKETTTEEPVKEESKPLFKIQILTSDKLLNSNDKQFKGLKDISHYKEKNIYKYTYGATDNYSEIVALRKSILQKFPDCFIIAMKGEERISIQEAREILKSQK